MNKQNFLKRVFTYLTFMFIFTFIPGAIAYAKKTENYEVIKCHDLYMDFRYNRLEAESLYMDKEIYVQCDNITSFTYPGLGYNYQIVYDYGRVDFDFKKIDDLLNLSKNGFVIIKGTISHINQLGMPTLNNCSIMKNETKKLNFDINSGSLTLKEFILQKGKNRVAFINKYNKETFKLSNCKIERTGRDESGSPWVVVITKEEIDAFDPSLTAYFDSQQTDLSKLSVGNVINIQGTLDATNLIENKGMGIVFLECKTF